MDPKRGVIDPLDLRTYDEDLTEPDAPVRRTVADETREMLQQRLVQAEEQMAQAVQAVRQWQPVIAACKAGLHALTTHEEQQNMQNVQVENCTDATPPKPREFALPLRGNGEYDRPIR